ncbi:hypothetical protein MMC29_003526 [Sticta canariensis]|nr:hypothetical protein [Sticta canariensis]
MRRGFVTSTSYLHTIASSQAAFQSFSQVKRQKLPKKDALHEKRRELLNEPQEVTQCSNLSILPTELVLAIFDELCMDDALCLALVAQRFWEIGWPNMEKKFMASMAPWAGHRLICLGDETEDHPLGSLSKNEEEELEHGLTEYELEMAKGLAEGQFLFDVEFEKGYNKDYLMDYSLSATTDIPVGLSKIVSSRYLDTEAHKIPSRRVISVAQQERCKMPWSVLSKIKRFSNEYLPNYFPNNRKWVLRNLTAHEFVRSEVLAGSSKQSGPFFDDIGFEHIVLSKVLWSSSPMSGYSCSVAVWRGEWAGHCLEIITFDDHIKAMQSNLGWKDVSEDAVDRILALYRAAFEWIDDTKGK